MLILNASGVPPPPLFLTPVPIPVRQMVQLLDEILELLQILLAPSSPDRFLSILERMPFTVACSGFTTMSTTAATVAATTESSPVAHSPRRSRRGVQFPSPAGDKKEDNGSTGAVRDDPVVSVPGRPGNVPEDCRRQDQREGYGVLLIDGLGLGTGRHRASWSAVGDTIPGGRSAGRRGRERVAGVGGSVIGAGAQRGDRGIISNESDLLIARAEDSGDDRRPQGRQRSMSLSA